ncbi:cytochrome c oxidase assembly factor Coa1 family protein [Oleiagrimonas sp. C23AA]|uniref:cytochrome c oxidase assembly factor Coa1 family protein n=1 Tax=Oleiagrimonas sp. C23AA TaxID=2719047 RepID=UPI00141D7B0B|nr:cytochrome c oxidase assembly factor Coa1 family protein [Oleiagrimonas sp. C23AA]NII10153.1 hypothetical protein [Oleiagrimonas sp. C23AA]
MENTSGGGSTATVPAEIDRWNWGAFLLNWIWGVGNNTFIALLMFVPLVNIAMLFVLGAKGSAWAWRNRRWESIAAFKAAQRKWARWGFAATGLFALLFAGMFIAIFASLKGSPAYQMAVRAVNSSPQAIQVIGRPVSTGTPSGSIRVSGPDGEASLAFSAEGPVGSGTVYVKATKSLGQWKLDKAVLEDAESGQRIDLLE